MNPQDPLAALHPLREPALVGWWPLAPGWWSLICVFGFVSIWAAYLLWRKHRRNAYRRIALEQLLQIHAQFNEHGDTRRCLAEVNALLKSVALVTCPRRRIAPACGEDWLAILNADLPQEHHLDAAFLKSVYGPEGEHPPVDAVLASARIWIRKHRGLPA